MLLVRSVRLLGLMAALFWGQAAMGQEVDRSASHGAWGVFADGTGDNRLWGVAAQAELGSLPLAAGAQPPPESILLLFTAPGRELSLEVGGQSPASGHISVGRERFELFFENGWGWLRDDRRTGALQRLLETRSQALVRLGDAAYSLSLEGFVPALADAASRCP